MNMMYILFDVVFILSHLTRIYYRVISLSLFTMSGQGLNDKSDLSSARMISTSAIP
jgi:hypothetical protein